MDLFKKFFLVLGFLTSCQTISYKQDYVYLANQEINSFVKEAKQSDRLILFGSGGRFLDRINSISLSFMSPESPTVEEARLQYYNLTRCFLNSINQNELIRPYLSNYPFTIHNLNLTIFYSQQIPDAVSAVTMGNVLGYGMRPNNVYYYGYSPCGEYIQLYKENYDLGLEVVCDYQNKNPECLIYPRSLSYPLIYLDGKRWFIEMQKTQGKSFADNFGIKKCKPEESSKEE